MGMYKCSFCGRSHKVGTQCRAARLNAPVEPKPIEPQQQHFAPGYPLRAANDPMPPPLPPAPSPPRLVPGPPKPPPPAPPELLPGPPKPPPPAPPVIAFPQPRRAPALVVAPPPATEAAAAAHEAVPGELLDVVMQAVEMTGGEVDRGTVEELAYCLTQEQLHQVIKLSGEVRMWAVNELAARAGQ